MRCALPLLVLLASPVVPSAAAQTTLPAGVGPGGASPAAGVKTELLGAFVPATKFALDGARVVFLAEEAFHGDRNGDGDALDQVLAVRGLGRGVETNLGLAVVETGEENRSFLVENGRLLALVSEADQGGLDRNGDGDALDAVLAAVDLDTGAVVNLGLAGSAPNLELGQGIGVVLVPEVGQGVDLDGNGTLSQSVPHVWEAATGSVTNLGLAAFTAGVAGGRVWFEASELTADRNGDGDQNDRVLHVFDPGTSTTHNTGLATYSVGSFFAPARPATSSTQIAWLVGEAQQGALDLNGDGDALDFVLHVHELESGTTTATALACTDPAPLAPVLAGERWVAFLVSEAAQGGADRNGDGDALDQVACVFDGALGTLTSAASQASTLALSGSRAVFLVREGAQGGSDLNGDGDALDFVPRVFDAASTSTLTVPRAAQGGETILGLPANPPVASSVSGTSGDLVLFDVLESADGGVDHNGDGDTSDAVLFVLDLATGTSTNLGLATARLAPAFATEGQRVLVLVDENAQGGQDLSGDGDAQDAVAHAWERGAPAARNLGLAVLDNPVRSPFELRGGAVCMLLEAGPSVGLLAITRFLRPQAR